jgi:uncharacterized protein (TIGR03118 family)
MRLLANKRWAIAAAIAMAAVIGGQPAAAQNQFKQTNLVSDVPGLAAHLDPQLSNPWGIAMSGGSPFWISDNNTGVSTLYNSAGIKQGLVVTIPGGTPTGTVFNNTGSFQLANGNNASFMFATQNGSIAAWNSAAGTTALIAATSPGAVYTGLAIGGSGATARLYAADLAGGAVDVYDNTFTKLTGSFVDPALPAGYSPFNIQNVGGSLFVAYALTDPVTHEETKGAGLGIVNEFDLNGGLLRRFATNGSLDAPWGFAQAPAGFGIFANALLIGNFGDGTIHGYDRTTGTEIGALLGIDGLPVVNDGLWAITFGNGGNGGTKDALYFTAGIDDEAHGLFGRLTVTPEPGSFGLMVIGLGLVSVVARRKKSRAG